nr:immunoglobulin heavy chain junction region [Mus musculus]MBK4197498.1 immunoglobulin heavy chain junction region [Mus musculus]
CASDQTGDFDYW